jgi:hypothetical protein
MHIIDATRNTTTPTPTPTHHKKSSRASRIITPPLRDIFILDSSPPQEIKSTTAA